MSARHEISCFDSEHMREGLRVYSSLTNFVAGEVLDIGKPHHTHTVWADPVTEVPLMEDFMDADGCRHYAIDFEEGS